MGHDLFHSWQFSTFSWSAKKFENLKHSHGLFMVSVKPMNFENAIFMGHENQFMVFLWLFHDVAFYSEFDWGL